jgi:RimJ/RimL family protein N-acetyltransferase
VDPLTEPPAPVLTTQRLALRSWYAGDVEPFLALSSDPEVMRHFPRPITREEAVGFVERHRGAIEAGRPGLFALARLEDRRFLGFVGLAVPSFEAAFTPCVEIGWRLARDAWGHGFATEAALAALEHGFTTLGLEEIVSFTAVPNEPSQAVMRRIGMHRDPGDDFDHPALSPGHPLARHVLYRLRAAEWRASQVDRGAGEGSTAVQ